MKVYCMSIQLMSDLVTEVSVFYTDNALDRRTIEAYFGVDCETPAKYCDGNFIYKAWTESDFNNRMSADDIEVDEETGQVYTRKVF